MPRLPLTRPGSSESHWQTRLAGSLPGPGSRACPAPAAANPRRRAGGGGHAEERVSRWPAGPRVHTWQRPPTVICCCVTRLKYSLLLNPRPASALDRKYPGYVYSPRPRPGPGPPSGEVGGRGAVSGRELRASPRVAPGQPVPTPRSHRDSCPPSRAVRASPSFRRAGGSRHSSRATRTCRRRGSHVSCSRACRARRRRRPVVTSMSGPARRRRPAVRETARVRFQHHFGI